MIDRGSNVPVNRQAQLLELSRSSVYYGPRPISDLDLQLMRRLDELRLEAPFYGARKLAAQLRHEGQEVGRRHVGKWGRGLGDASEAIGHIRKFVDVQIREPH